MALPGGMVIIQGVDRVCGMALPGGMVIVQGVDRAVQRGGGGGRGRGGALVMMGEPISQTMEQLGRATGCDCGYGCGCCVSCGCGCG